MRLLLVDNSNTRTKIAVTTPAGLAGPVERLPTSEVSAATLAPLLASFRYDAAVICSVVPAKATALGRALSHVPLHQISDRSRMPIAIDYPNPGQIGADRLANAVAVHARHGAPSIVIDFGTAVTFDVVGSAPSGDAESGRAAYLGGVIAPGLASMTDYLHQRTALLPRIDLAEPRSAIGKSTVEAMRAGAVYGYRGLIREILAAVSRELTAPPTVVATGGDAALIADRLPEVGEVLPDLTLEGIDLVGRLNL